MIIHITTTYQPIGIIDVVGLKCPKTDTIEPMKLMLFQTDVDNGLIYKKTKKVTGVFHLASNDEEIPVRLWTREMESFFQEAQKNATIEKPFWKFTLTGKIYLGFLLSIMTFLSVWLGYLLVDFYLDNSLQKNIEIHLAQPMKVGDQYFATITTNGLPAKWIQVVSMSGNTLTAKFGKESIPAYNQYSRTDHEKSLQISHSENDYDKELYVLVPHTSGGKKYAYIDKKNNIIVLLTDKYTP